MMSQGPTKTHAALYRMPKMILVCLFAVCTLLATSYGLGSYQKIQQMTQRNFTGRTGLTYVATKLRQIEAAVVEIPAAGELVLVQEIDQRLYATRIYLDNGRLMESFGRYEPDAAVLETPIIEAQDFFVVFMGDDLIEITLTDPQGDKYSMVVCLPTKEAAA